MKNAKFIQILRTLNKEEFKKLGKFVRSPVFNTNKTIIKLYDILKPIYPEFNDDFVEKERIFKKLFSYEKFKEKKIRNVSSKMLKMLEEFLGFTYYHKDTIRKELNILNELSNKSLENLTTSKYNLIKKTINKIEIKDIAHYYFLYELNEIYKESLFNTTKNLATNFAFIQNIFNNLSNFIVLIFINYKIEKNLLADEYTDKIDSHLVDLVLEYLDSNQNQFTDSIILYYKLLKLLEGGDDNTYNEIKELKNRHLSTISYDLKSKINIVLLQYLMKNKNSKNYFNYRKEDLELMGSPMDHLLGGFIPDNVFNHYVIDYISLEKFEECKYFINKYNPFLKHTIRENVVNFNLGKLYLSMGKYDKSLNFFLKLKKIHWWYEINIKCSILICYIELEKINEAKSLIKSYRKFLNSNKITDSSAKEVHLNFVLITEYLLQFYITGNYTILEKTCKQLLYTNNLTHRKWLSRKIDFLLSTYKNKKASVK